MTACTKILIANRGEIAVRILRTLRRMAIPSVVVFHASERGSLAVREADEAREISGSSPVAAYLDIPQLLEACRATGADALHPGYGFLSEHAAFATAVGEAGLCFIGPSPETIALMGDKIRARETVAAAGFPVAPSISVTEPVPEVLRRAEEVGYPLLAKAAGGGGGRGMRVIASAKELAEKVAAAASEAERSFGDGRVYLEKYIARPRHLEVQVLSDSHGNHLHLWERECSIQRRFQKIVEESPAPGLSEGLRGRLCRAAVGIARAADNVGVGTVEFLLAPGGEFYFLEMNTRLQVEHPVTEMVTGLDLVEWQVRVARGETLTMKQEQIGRQGHAIECRICAEDAENGFAPTTGEVALLRPPEGPGVRFDHGLTQGRPVSTAFDSLLGKLICHGAGREEALARMRAALGELVLLGVTCNAALLRRVVSHPAFVAGETHTHFLEEHRERLAGPAPDDDLAARLIAAAALVTPERSASAPEPYASIGHWRN